MWERFLLLLGLYSAACMHMLRGMLCIYNQCTLINTTTTATTTTNEIQEEEKLEVVMLNHVSPTDKSC